MPMAEEGGGEGGRVKDPLKEGILWQGSPSKQPRQAHTPPRAFAQEVHQTFESVVAASPAPKLLSRLSTSSASPAKAPVSAAEADEPPPEPAPASRQRTDARASEPAADGVATRSILQQCAAESPPDKELIQRSGREDTRDPPPRQSTADTTPDRRPKQSKHQESRRTSWKGSPPQQQRDSQPTPSTAAERKEADNTQQEDHNSCLHSWEEQQPEQRGKPQRRGNEFHVGEPHVQKHGVSREVEGLLSHSAHAEARKDGADRCRGRERKAPSWWLSFNEQARQSDPKPTPKQNGNRRSAEDQAKSDNTQHRQATPAKRAASNGDIEGKIENTKAQRTPAKRALSEKPIRSAGGTPYSAVDEKDKTPDNDQQRRRAAARRASEKEEQQRKAAIPDRKDGKGTPSNQRKQRRADIADEEKDYGLDKDMNNERDQEAAGDRNETQQLKNRATAGANAAVNARRRSSVVSADGSFDFNVDTTPKQGSKWAEEQEEALMAAWREVEPSEPHYWHKIARKVPGKTATQCSEHFNQEVENTEYRNTRQDGGRNSYQQNSQKRHGGASKHTSKALAQAATGTGGKKGKAAARKAQREKAWEDEAEQAIRVDDIFGGDAAPPPREQAAMPEKLYAERKRRADNSAYAEQFLKKRANEATKEKKKQQQQQKHAKQKQQQTENHQSRSGKEGEGERGKSLTRFVQELERQHKAREKAAMEDAMDIDEDNWQDESDDEDDDPFSFAVWTQKESP